MVSGHGYSAKGSEIIMIIAFIAGLVIVFYMLAKREAEAAKKALLGGASDAMRAAADAAAKLASDTTRAMKEAAEATAQEAAKATMQVDAAGRAYLGTPITTVQDYAANLIPVVEGRIPLAKLYKNGQWYLLFNCDLTGHNCEAYREAGILDQIALAMAKDVSKL